MILDHQGQPGGSLEGYLGSIVVRLRAAAAARGLGALGVTALCVTAVCVFLANRAAFSDASVVGSRTVLLASLAAVLVLLLVLPLRRLVKGRAFARAADEAERRSPEFGGRLRTWADERDRAEVGGRAPSPLLALLARETSQASAVVPLDAVVSRALVGLFAATGLVALLALFWLGSAGPGYWSYGTSRLWTGWFLTHEEPLYELKVEPGDTSIRQGGRLEVTALPLGFEPPLVELYAKFESSVDWERAPMGPQLEGAGYGFSFSMVREPLRYYVEAGRLRSREFKVDVIAMPTVENIRLELEYPAWSGLKPSVQDPGGDIMAVAGTKVGVILTTDKELADGLLVVGEQEVPLRGNRAEIVVGEDSSYHVAAMHRGERVRLTEDYFITAVPDEKPEVKILEPGRDWRASSIEEVAVRLEATDDFGLRGLQLHYAVNGVDQEAVSLPARPGALEATGSHTFFLENLGGGARTAPESLEEGGESLPPPAPEAGLIPGDLISYYIIAKDAKKEVRSDMYFINVQPFERRFSQSQQAGGQGQQGQQQDEISRRQKEIILATWNLIKERDAEDGREERKLRESAEMLSELQGTLMQQAQTLVQRTRARQLTRTDPKFAQFAELLEQAAGFMEPAAEALQAFRLDDAVGPEQQALQFLLRAENLFTDIQVSMGRGGGGGGGGASRDLAEMFELEMDLEKNQYETGSGSSGQQIEQEIDEAMKKLEELARRQERLAEQAQDRSRASFEQRWQQEMLRREAEDLKRELEQLQRRQQSQGGQQSRSQGGQSSQAQGSSSGQSGMRQQLDRTIRQLERAAREMERGGQGSDQRASSARAQQELQEALEALQQQRQQQSQSAVSEMAEEAARLAEEQEQAAAELDRSLKVALEALKAQGGRQNGPLPTGMTREEEIDLADRKRDMRDRLSEVEQGIQKHSRMLRQRNDEASKALMNALIELQQSEALPAMQYAEDLIRRGLAPYAAGNEEAISRALRRLRDNLRQAGELAQKEGGGAERGLERLLSSVEQMRRDLERAMVPGQDGEQNRSGQAPGQQPGGDQPGQQSGQGAGGIGDPSRPGSRTGVGGASGEWRGGWGGTESLGDGRPRGPYGARPLEPAERDRMERALEAGIADIPRLAQQLRTTREFDPREIAELRDFARELGDGRFLGNPELLEQEYRNVLAMLEQIEVKLRRQVELDDKEEVRAIVSEPVPESYREAVAEYYRRLGGSE